MCSQRDFNPRLQITFSLWWMQTSNARVENRQKSKIRVIIVNQDNRTMIIPSVIDLLPFGFGS